MLNIDIAPPIAFAAANCQFLAQVPNGIEGYWSADIKAVRRGVLHEIFTGVLFVEKPGAFEVSSADYVLKHL